MEDHKIVGWPDIQYLIEEEGFFENAALIHVNETMGIDSSTYLINKKWLDSLGKED